MNNLYFLFVITLCFYIIGGIVDYWQSAVEHNKVLPALIKNYFAVFWLLLYSGILPFGLVYAASNYDLKTSLSFVGYALIGIVLWDIAYSKLDKKMVVSDQKDYFYWGKKYFALSKKQIVTWHFIRIVLACTILSIAQWVFNGGGRGI